MKEDNVEKIFNFLSPVLLFCFLSVITIFVARILFYLIITMLSKFYLVNKNKLKEQRRQPKSTITVHDSKRNEELFRDKKLENMEIEKNALQVRDDEKISENFMDNADSDYESGRIVGIVKPVGFWTSLILGDQLTKVFEKANLLSKRSKKSFWISMLETQSRMIRDDKKQL